MCMYTLHCTLYSVHYIQCKRVYVCVCVHAGVYMCRCMFMNN